MRTTINPEGNWSFWTDAQREELKNPINARGDKIVFENESIRIWTIHLKPGGRLPFHKHEIPYFWTALAAGTSRSYYNDGSVIDSHYEQGSTRYFPDLSHENYFIHDLKNTGETTLIFTTVEFLKPFEK